MEYQDLNEEGDGPKRIKLILIFPDGQEEVIYIWQ
jgi:hypothetical protein